MYMDWRKIYWIFFYGKVLTFQYICSLLLSVREVSSWEMSAFINTTWYHDFFVDWLHSPYLYYLIEHCTVTISSHLGCKCAKGTGIQIYSIIKEKKAWRNMNFCTTIIMDIDPMDTLCWNLWRMYTFLMVTNLPRASIQVYGVREGSILKKRIFFSTVTPDGWSFQLAV